MIRLLFNNMKRTKGMTFLFLLAFAIIFIVTPIALNAIKDTNASIETDITYYSRGSYDVLVRAPEAIQPVEKELGIVPENYLGAGGGGISLAQWEVIKERDDVEIAAPVASLGHYSGVSTSLGVLPEPEESTRYTVNYYTSDGINKYVFKEYISIFLESPIQNKMMPDKKFDYLFSRHGMLINANDVAVFPLPTSHHLLVGIDPVEEEKLTGIVFDDISEGSARQGSGTWMVNNNPIYEGAFAIPVAQLENVATPFDTKVTIDRLAIDKDQTKKIRDNFGLNDQPPYNEFMNTSDSKDFANLVSDLIDYPAAETKMLEANLNEILHPFNSEESSIFIDEDSNITAFDIEGDYTEVSDIRSSSEYYIVEPIQYEITKDKLAVKKIGELEESFLDIDKELVAITNKMDRIPTYREVSRKGQGGIHLAEGETLDFIIDPVSSFNTSLAREASLASSPLGIYHLAPIIHIEDGKRQEMTPTHDPGSFVSAPAGGVTNIQAAEQVKGNLPIDAIRVRVAGITSYTPEAKEQIEQLVQDIEKMGLTATVIAGASPQMMQIEVENIGLVEEAWTSLGAAGSIISQWNVTNLILTIAFLFVTVMYIYHRMRIWQSQKQEDISLFIQLGWERKKILKLMGGEIAVLTLIAWVFSLLGLSMISKQLNLSVSVIYIQAIVSFVTILILILLATIQLKANRKTRQEKVIKPKREWKSLIAKNISYNRKQIISPFIQLVAVSGLSSFVYLSLSKTITQTNLTILGEYINTRTSDWHLILIVGAYVLAIITLIESITSVMISKKKEIATYLSIGWKLAHIFKLYFKEIAIWTGIALIIGSIGSFIVYAIFYPLQLDSVLILFATFLGFYIIILVLSAIILQNYLKKNIGDNLLLRRRNIST